MFLRVCRFKTNRSPWENFALKKEKQIFSDAINSSPFIEPGFHYRVLKSPPADPVYSGALCVQFPFYTRLHFVERLSTLAVVHCTLFIIQISGVNRLTPNDPYMGRTAPLTSKRCILHIYSTNIGTEYFKHVLYSRFFSLQNAVCFIMLTCLVPVLITFYIQGVLKLKKK